MKRYTIAEIKTFYKRKTLIKRKTFVKSKTLSKTMRPITRDIIFIEEIITGQNSFDEGIMCMVN